MGLKVRRPAVFQAVTFDQNTGLSAALSMRGSPDNTTSVSHNLEMRKIAAEKIVPGLSQAKKKKKKRSFWA